MSNPTRLNLLVVDDNQLFAEQLVDKLSDYYDRVNLGFLDAKDELIKLLRQSWDVLVMGKAYDMTFVQVIDIIKQQDLDLPVIAMIPTSGVYGDLSAKDKPWLELVGADDATEPSLPLYLHWGAADAIAKNRLVEMAAQIYQQHRQKQVRDELAKLRCILKDAEQRANLLIKNSKSAVAYIEDGIHIYANEPYLQLFGFKNLDELRGVPVVDLIASNNIKDFKQFLKDFEKGNRDNVEFKFESVRTDGSTFAAKLQLAAATCEGKPCQQVIIQQEAGNSAEYAKKLAAIERKDALTGLYNRRGFEETLASIRAATVAQNGTAGLVDVRIDNVGQLQASLGFQSIDEIVMTLSQALQHQVAQVLGEPVQDGLISRFNDVNFMLILPNLDEARLLAFCQQLQQAVAGDRFAVGSRSVKVTVTLGATMINTSSPDTTTLIERVTHAVVTAFENTDKQGNGLYLYDPSQFASSDESALLEALKSTLQQNKFGLLYQPIYDIETDTSNLFEIYLRLPLADGTSMKPNAFATVAAQHGLMEKIDRWLLLHACKRLKDYRANVDANARLLVHLSAQSLSDDSLPKFVQKLLQAVGGQIDGALTLQFAEHTLNDYLAVAAKQRASFAQIGCQFGIYDYGSTPNTAEVITNVQPDIVRLAANQIKDLSNPDNVQTLMATVQQINATGAACLMPYIEDPATMSTAWTVGARYLQGDYLQAPSPDMHIETEA